MPKPSAARPRRRPAPAAADPAADEPTTISRGARPQITESARILDTPGAPNGQIAPTPGRAFTVVADPRREYVAGGTAGSAQWYLNYLRSLGFAIDDVTADFGDDLYERMALDPQVASCVNVFRAAVLEDGMHLASAVEDADEDGYALARELCDEATRMLDELETPLDDVLWDLLAAVALGNRVAEQRYELGPGAGGKPQLVLVDLVPKPRQALAFVVNSFSRVIGYIGRIPGAAWPVQAGTFVSPETIPNLLPAEKFARLTFRPKDRDPRGTSVLRPAYNPWNLKQQVLREQLRYLTQFAAPGLIGTTAQEAQALPLMDSLGNPILDANGNVQYAATPEAGLLNSLIAWRNGSAIVVPFGTEVDVVQSEGTGEAFTEALATYNREIAKAILGQTLATEEGEHQARAAAEVHADVLATQIRQARRTVTRMLLRQVLRPWCRYNYGEAATALLPSLSLGQSEHTDIPDLMQGVAALKQAGYPAPSQLTALDELLGLPARLPEEIALATQAARAAAAPPPAVPPGASPREGGSKPPKRPGAGSDDDAEADPARFADEPVTPRGADEPLAPLPDQVTYTPKDRTWVAQDWSTRLPALAGLLGAGGRRWAWSDRVGYLDIVRRRPVAAATLLGARDELLNLHAGSIRRISERLADGEISLSQWQAAMRLHIKTAFGAEYTLGRGGLPRMTRADWADLGPLVRFQYAKLDAFARDIAAGRLSAKQIAARAVLYMSAAVQAYERGQAARFDVRLPAQPGDGSTPCFVNCRCHWDLRPRADGSVAATWIAHDDDRTCAVCTERAETWNPLVVVPAHGGTARGDVDQTEA